MKKITVEVLRFFCTDDRWGPVIGKVGDKLDLTEGLAVSLTKLGFVKKYRPAKKKDNKEE